ncbi:MAG: hypothetical protein JSU58_01120 [Dehalococcoidales bacterium]|nr:MAG: hypothetical protein JSU58_01120 [Dehalococcoidales bacterium]
MIRNRWIAYGISIILCVVAILLTVFFNHDGYYIAMVAVILSMILTRIHRRSITDEREYQMILRVDNLTLGILLVLLFAAGALSREYMATGQAEFITFVSEHFVVLILASLIGIESIIGVILFRRG